MLPPLKEEISGNHSRSKSTLLDNWPDNTMQTKEPGNIVWQLSVEDNTYKLKGIIQMWLGADLTIQEACAALRNLLIKENKYVSEETTLHEKRQYTSMCVATESNLRNMFAVGTDK